MKRQPYSGTLRALLVEPGVVFRHTPGQPVCLTVGGQRFEAANAGAAATLATEAKRLSKLQALFALHGGRLDLIEADNGAGEIVATVGPVTRRFADLGAAETWFHRTVVGS